MEKNEVKEEKTINMPAEQNEDLNIFARKVKSCKRNGKNVPFEKRRLRLQLLKHS